MVTYLIIVSTLCYKLVTQIKTDRIHSKCLLTTKHLRYLASVCGVMRLNLDLTVNIAKNDSAWATEGTGESLPDSGRGDGLNRSLFGLSASQLSRSKRWRFTHGSIQSGKLQTRKRVRGFLCSNASIYGSLPINYLTSCMAYSPEKKREILDKFYESIRDGLSFAKARKAHTDMPAKSTLRLWINESEEESDTFARACEDRQDALLDKIQDLAEQRYPDMVAIWGARMEIETLKYLLKIMNPQKFGDRITTDTNVTFKDAVDELTKQLPDYLQ